MEFEDNQRSTPRLRKRWALAVEFLAVLVGITVASAQPRQTSRSFKEKAMPETYFCRMHESIPCLSGKVTDPNGDHMPWTLVTVLPMTSCQARMEWDPYFDIPWDPNWTPGVPPQLIARHPQSNTAVVVTCADPNAVINMTLKPSLRIQGRVVDPDGNPVHHSAWAVVGWKHEVHGPLPIVAVEIGEGGLFNLAGIPKGLDCVLGVYTKELGIENIPLDGYNSNAIDVGTLRLAPLEGPRQYHPKETDWQTAYHQIYRLADHEDLKLIKPPFAMARQHYHHHRTEFFQVQPLLRRYCTWTTELKTQSYFGGASPWQSVARITEECMGIRGYEVDLPEEIAKAKLPIGDMIWREGISTERKLKALKKLLAEELNHRVTFVKRSLMRDVVIVSGRYEFKSNPLDTIGTDLSSSNELESLSVFLETLSHNLGVPFVNHVDTPDANVPKLISFATGLRMRRLRGAEREALVFELGQWTRRTSLQFEIVRQPVDTWVGVEY